MRKIHHASTLLLLVVFLLGCTTKQDEMQRAEEEPSAAMEMPETTGGAIEEPTSPSPTEASQTTDWQQSPNLALPEMAEEGEADMAEEGEADMAEEAAMAEEAEAEEPEMAEKTPKKLLARPMMVRSMVPTVKPKTALEPTSPEPTASEPATAAAPTEPQVLFYKEETPPQIEETSPEAKEAPTEANEAYKTVRVFYGTDRKVTTGITSHPLGRIPWSFLAMATGIASLLSIVICSFWVHGKKAVMIPLLLLLATAGLGAVAVLIPTETKPDIARTDVAYSNERGEFELGTCDVSIPACHKLAELESPSIFHFEIIEDPTKHVVLLGIDRLEEGPFIEELRETIQKSEGKEAFVFVHGYNVTFEDAARRTAQLAYDLEFKGAPILYSWPSQGGLLQYTVDENNVDWTVPHLKQFLKLIAEQSGAKRIHLIAHSMGNRALTSALEKISYTDAKDGPIFNEVTLTAPDIDAEIFRRDLAPQIVKTARRVTLYASSNDEALIASKTVHGYPRAGESGEAVVVVQGIDTIDVSGLDTSLLGHSYYGSNDTVLIDMAQLLLDSKPPTLRTKLQLITRNGLNYWVFLIEKIHTKIKDRVGNAQPEL